MEVLLLDVVQEEEGEAASPCVRLVVRAYPADAKGFVSLTQKCERIAVFEQAVAELRKRMDDILLSAREIFQQYQPQVKGEEAVTEFHKAEEIWQALEECASIDEMRELFNTLSRSKRQEVANFIFTQLNIFKGAASTFSQHYDEEEYLLD